MALVMFIIVGSKLRRVMVDSCVVWSVNAHVMIDNVCLTPLPCIACLCLEPTAWDIALVLIKHRLGIAKVAEEAGQQMSCHMHKMYSYSCPPTMENHTGRSQSKLGGHMACTCKGQ